jgi:hypothetical protein
MAATNIDEINDTDTVSLQGPLADRPATLPTGLSGSTYKVLNTTTGKIESFWRYSEGNTNAANGHWFQIGG